jgi:iron complex transport system substrate-binding protein
MPRTFIFLFTLSIGFFFQREALALEKQECERIISLSPSATEVVYDLGLGEKVVGTSSYVTYPKQAAALPPLGGLFDPNLEKIIELAPNLVILLTSQHNLGQKLKRVGISTLEINHQSLNGILASYTLIGDSCNKSSQAEKARQSLSAELDKLTLPVQEESQRPRVLVLIGALTSPGNLSGLYVSGQDGMYGSILERLGAKNCISSSTVALGSLSIEGLAVLDPDFIVQIATGASNSGQQKDLWNTSRLLPGKKEPVPLLIIHGSYAVIPGPRIIKLMQEIRDFFIQHRTS